MSDYMYCMIEIAFDNLDEVKQTISKLLNEYWLLVVRWLKVIVNGIENMSEKKVNIVFTFM